MAGFPTTTSEDPDAWLTAHAAFVVPIAFALYRDGADAVHLANDRRALQLMVRATRQAFRVLQAAGNGEIPTNLKALYLWSPEAFAVRYWQRVMARPWGEMWFAAHGRAAPEEMTSLASELLAAVERTGQPAPELKVARSLVDERSHDIALSSWLRSSGSSERRVRCVAEITAPPRVEQPLRGSA